MRTLATVAPFGFDFDTNEFLAAYAAFGCTGAQFYRNPDRAPTVAEALSTCARHGMTIDSMHALFSHDLDAASPDPEQRAHCLRVFEDEGRLALELGGPVVVVHPSANFPPDPDSPFDFPHLEPEEAARLETPLWPHFDDFARRLAEVGERLGVTYVFENMGYIAPLGHEAAELARHVAAVGSPHVAMCFDTGHAHFAGNMPAAFEIAAPITRYIHLHDNDRTVDNHALPGEGTIDWLDFADRLDRHAVDCPCMIEVFKPLDEIRALDTRAYADFLARACALDTANA